MIVVALILTFSATIILSCYLGFKIGQKCSNNEFFEQKKLSEASHELCNVLNILIGYPALIQRAIEDFPENDSKEKVKTYALAISKGSQSISEIAKNLKKDTFTLSTPQQVDLLDVLQDLKMFCEPKIKLEGIDLDIEEPPLDCRYVYGAKTNILQILINLVSNSRDALLELPKQVSKKPHIQIQVEPNHSSNHLAIFIKDNGPGVSEFLSTKLIQSAVTTKTTGQGIGLVLSSRYAEHMGGKLLLVKPKEPTTFALVLKRLNQS